MRPLVIVLTVAVVGLTSAEALIRVAVDDERSSPLQQLAFKLALGGLLGSAAFVAGLFLLIRISRRD